MNRLLVSKAMMHQSNHSRCIHLVACYLLSHQEMQYYGTLIALLGKGHSMVVKM